MLNFRDWNRKEFYLTYWIYIILVLTSIIACLCYVLDHNKIINFDKVNHFIIDYLLIDKEGILISIAAIFIGIYFSIFTILLSIKQNSKIAFMGLKTFKELIQYLKYAFIGAFIYIIYAILYPLISLMGKEGLYKFIYELFLSLLVIYLLLSALRVGIAFILIFRDDLNSFYSSLKSEQIKKEEYDDTIYKLKTFLETYEQNEVSKKVTLLNEINKNKNPKQDKKKV